MASELADTGTEGQGGEINWVQTGINEAKILGSDLSDEEKAKASRRLAEDTAANYFTAGAWGGIQKLDSAVLGGQIDDWRTKLSDHNPIHGFADKMGAGVLGTFGGGPTQGTVTREQMRGQLQSLGVTDQNHNLTLANGGQYNIAQNQSREWFNPDGRRSDQTGVSKLNSWDVDYTRDLDGVMNVGGNALSMLLYGAGDQYTGQMANYFTNAAVSDSGTADLTQESFSASQANLQGFFKQAGITSKSDANALANQLANEGRISQTQLVTVHQGINLAFDDNGFQAANQLLEGVKLGRKGGDEPKPSKTSQKEISDSLKPETPGKENAQQPVQTPKFSLPQIKGSDSMQGAEVENAEASELTDPMEIQNG